MMKLRSHLLHVFRPSTISNLSKLKISKSLKPMIQVAFADLLRGMDVLPTTFRYVLEWRHSGHVLFRDHHFQRCQVTSSNMAGKK